MHHVIRPERDTGRRVAHLLGGRFRDFAEIAPDYGITRLAPPAALVGRPLVLGDVWRTHNVQLISVRVSDGRWIPLEDGVSLASTDYIVAAGSPGDLERFSK